MADFFPKEIIETLSKNDKYVDISIPRKNKKIIPKIIIGETLSKSVALWIERIIDGSNNYEGIPAAKREEKGYMNPLVNKTFKPYVNETTIRKKIMGPDLIVKESGRTHHLGGLNGKVGYDFLFIWHSVPIN